MYFSLLYHTDLLLKENNKPSFECCILKTSRFLSYNKKVTSKRKRRRHKMSDVLTAPVKIKIITTITQQDTAPEKFELWSEGIIMQKKDQIYLRYEEVQEDQHRNTTLRFGQKDAVIIRNGDIKMRMPFVLGQARKGHYNSNYGQIPIVTLTKEMKFEPSESIQNGRFYVQYELLVGEQSVGDYCLELNYTEGN